MIKIDQLPTGPPSDINKKELVAITDDYCARLAEQHRRLIASNKYAVLVIFQGMDASGKDGAVKNVFKDCVHNNLHVYSFKKPTELEFAHDFLWRVHQKCPPKGSIHVFNRSHYEDILIQRVHGWIDEEKVQKRMAAINSFEDLLQFDNNTILFKFFLHISKDQQAVELQQRIDEPKKHWKHNTGDWEQREHWDNYMKAYEDVLNWSTTPWTVVPVDRRWYRNYIVAKTITEKLESLNMEYPNLEK